MDKFVTFTKVSKVHGDTLNSKYITQLQHHIKENKNVFICGGCGVGKSFVLNSVLDNSNSMELNYVSMKLKDLLKDTSTHLYIEDYDDEPQLFKSIIEDVSENKKINKGSFVVVSKEYHLFPNFEVIHIKKHSVDDLLTLVPKEERLDSIKAAVDAEGSIRDFLCYREYPDVKDSFETPKEYAARILCDPNPLDFKDNMSEHGHIWDMIHENYPDSYGTNIPTVIESLSRASMYDCAIYNGQWELMPYFILHAVIIPKNNMGKVLRKENIRSGSCWTKNGNYKMRLGKVKDMLDRGPRCMGIDSLYLLKKYAENGDVSLFPKYGLQASDFDVINHLCIGSKLKTRDVANIKKAITNELQKHESLK